MNEDLGLDKDLELLPLKKINKTFSPGKIHAVVGSIGSGKSTLLLGILRELFPKSGEVRVSGSVAYVPQESFLLNDTIRENVLFGREFQRSRYLAALAKTKLLEDLRNFKTGDLTEIGERGINLSGGQKQRVSLARALYADSDIYLIDDALSALDAEVGKAVFERMIKGSLRGRTVVLVTHASYLLPEVDTVTLMKRGEIVAEGSYQSLRGNREFREFFQDLGKNEEETRARGREASCGSPDRKLSLSEDDDDFLDVGEEKDELLRSASPIPPEEGTPFFSS